MRVILCSLAAVCCFSGTWAGSLPSFIKPCSKSDPKLNQCIENLVHDMGRKFVMGIPELGIETLDPAHLGDIPVVNPALKLTFFDTVVTGLSGFRLNKFRINPEQGKSVLDFTANVTLKANYDMNGQILILPIKGNGQTKIKVLNLNIIVKYDYTEKNGYWSIDKYTSEYKMEHAQFKFTNLFNGNKQLADTTMKFLNANWSIIMTDIAPSVFYSIIDKCLRTVEKLFKNVPANMLMLP